MKTYSEGEWTVTTPIYIGNEVDVEKASRCLHPKFSELTRTVRNDMVLVHEGCEACVAARVKYRPVDETDRRLSKKTCKNCRHPERSHGDPILDETCSLGDCPCDNFEGMRL